MKYLLLIFVGLLFVFAGCQSGEAETAVSPTPVLPTPTDTPIPPTPTPEPTAVSPTEEPETVDLIGLEEALQAVVDAQVEAGFPGAVLLVDAPDIGFKWQGAGGMADVDAGIPMEPDTPFRLGGTEFMMTGAVIVRLVEEDLIKLDDPISLYLDAEITDQLNGPDGEPYGEMITVRHLLNNTSGVAGYFFRGEEDKDANQVNDFMELIVADPDKVWQPEEMIVHSTKNMASEFAPGEGWGGSDVNATLLGLVIEAVAGMNLDEAYQKWLFEPLGMKHTFMAQAGDSRMKDVAQANFNPTVNVSDYSSLSWMWGDVVSTTGDINRFMWALINGDIFSDPASKELMLERVSMASGGYPGISLGLGVLTIDFNEFGMPEIGEILGNSGAWNGFAYYWPKHNIVLTGTLNQVQPMGAYTELAMPTMLTVLPYVAED